MKPFSPSFRISQANQESVRRLCGEPRQGGLALSTPHRIALLRLDRVRETSDLLRSTEIRGWQFLIHDGDRVIASTDAVLNQKGGFDFGQINEGPFNGSMEQAICKAEALPESDKLILSLSSSRACPLHRSSMAACRRRENDLVVPLPPAPGEFRPLEPLAAKDFLSATKRLAGASASRERSERRQQRR